MTPSWQLLRTGHGFRALRECMFGALPSVRRRVPYQPFLRPGDPRGAWPLLIDAGDGLSEHKPAADILSVRSLEIGRDCRRDMLLSTSIDQAVEADDIRPKVLQSVLLLARLRRKDRSRQPHFVFRLRLARQQVDRSRDTAWLQQLTAYIGRVHRAHVQYFFFDCCSTALQPGSSAAPLAGRARSRLHLQEVATHLHWQWRRPVRQRHCGRGHPPPAHTVRFGDHPRADASCCQSARTNRRSATFRTTGVAHRGGMARAQRRCISASLRRQSNLERICR